MLDRVTGGNIDLLAYQVPMGRAAFADEVARAIAWIAWPEASFVSGAVLPIGGRCALHESVKVGGPALRVCDRSVRLPKSAPNRSGFPGTASRPALRLPRQKH